MKLILGFFFLLSVSIYGHTQTTPKDISSSRLQSIIDLPLNEAIKQRAIYKVPLKSAYARQLAMSDKACEVEANQGQQPYNICMGKAEEQIDEDYASFYNNLQLLCHDQEQLRTLQSSEKVWLTYLDAMEKSDASLMVGGDGSVRIRERSTSPVNAESHARAVSLAGEVSDSCPGIRIARLRILRSEHYCNSDTRTVRGEIAQAKMRVEINYSCLSAGNPT
jgi:hypothetical protein